MKYIRVTKENIANEHICCAITKEEDCQVRAKKGWLKDRFDEGLVFLKSEERGKCFIEYLPAEYAWCPIEANQYMYIDCLWVSGKFKGKGYANELLEQCILDSKQKGKKGLVLLSSKKKRPYLADAKFLQYQGFQLADTYAPYFELYYLPFIENEKKPSFRVTSKIEEFAESGLVIFYSDQCPFTAKYVPKLKETAKRFSVPVQLVHLVSGEAARNAPTPYTSFSMFYHQQFITHEIPSEAKFVKLLGELQELAK